MAGWQRGRISDWLRRPEKVVACKKKKASPGDRRSPRRRTSRAADRQATKRVINELPEKMRRPMGDLLQSAVYKHELDRMVQDIIDAQPAAAVDPAPLPASGVLEYLEIWHQRVGPFDINTGPAIRLFDSADGGTINSRGATSWISGSTFTIPAGVFIEIHNVMCNIPGFTPNTHTPRGEFQTGGGLLVPAIQSRSSIWGHHDLGVVEGITGYDIHLAVYPGTTVVGSPYRVTPRIEPGGAFVTTTVVQAQMTLVKIA